MITLKKLYFEPNKQGDHKLRSIEFDRGLNFIIGEKSENLTNKKEENKMNGVGKSLLIESINFCLLKKADTSRVSKIPDINLNSNIYICLDFEIEKEKGIDLVTVRRNRTETDPISIVVNDDEKTFDDLNSARKYLEYLFFDNGEVETNRPSFRSMLSIFIRDEESRYNDLLKPHFKSEVSSYEELLKPHLYLFQVDLEILDQIKKLTLKSKALKKTVSSLREDFSKIGIAEKEVSSYLNDLKGSVEKLNLAIEELKPSEGLIQERNNLNDLQVKLEKFVNERAGKEFLVKKIKAAPKIEKLNTKQIQIVYNHFSSGLGDLVKKSFDQVLEFKSQVDDFQVSLTNEKLTELNGQIAKLDEEIAILDEKISKIYKKFETREKIDSLKEALSLEREKNRELEMLSSTYDLLEAKRAEQKSLNKRKAALVEDLGVLLFETSQKIKLFEDDLKKMHDYIAGNQRCQFEIEINEKTSSTKFIDFDYRIKLDGSSGINRIKVFIYDTLLLTNEVTAQRHFGFLIHDNIFASTGRDDMTKSLNYLYELSKRKNFQYILTMNKDEFDSQVENFNFDYQKLKRAEFTRKDPFLGFEYSEL